MKVENPRIPQEKQCIKCREWRTIKHFSIYRYTTNQGKESRRADSHCKACRLVLKNRRYHVRRQFDPKFIEQQRKNAAVHRERVRKRVKPELVAKRCTGCALMKMSEEFYRRPGSPDGFYQRCKQCTESERADLRSKQGTVLVARQNRRKILGKYKLSNEAYERMAAEQNSKCAACGQTPDSVLCVDHDHSTGRVRGLLCKRCNWVLGHANEDPGVLHGLLNYIAARCLRAG